MGRNKNFLAWLINIQNKKPLYIDANNMLQEGDAATLSKINGEPANLETETTGWRDTLVKFGRSDKYAGIIRDMTVPLIFSREAAKILRTKFWGGKSYEAMVYFALSKLDRLSTLTKYEPWFYGELDFSQYKQNKKKETVEISVLEGGPSKYLKAFEGTTFEFDIATNPMAVNVYMDGLPFTNRLEYTIFEQQDVSPTPNQNLVAMGIIFNEGSTQGILNLDEPQREQPDYPNPDRFMSSYDKTISVNLTGFVKISAFTNARPTTYVIIKFNINTGVRNDYYVFQGNLPNLNYTANFNLTIPMVPGDELYFEQNRGIFDGHPDNIITEGKMFVLYDVTFTPTVIKALRGEDVLAQLTNKITKGLYQSSSNALRNLRSLVFTSGTSIRGNIDSTMKTTLEEFNKAIKPFNLGIGIQNDMIICEEIPYFFQQNVILSLGTVDELTVDVATDKIYNTIKVGYKNVTYDNVNGTDEFNVTQQYTSDVTKVVKELDLISPYRADMTGIELTRLNLTGKTTTDNKADNETFILNINSTPETIGTFTNVYRLFRQTYLSLTGVLHPLKAFNIEFSPKRMLLKWQQYFNGIFDRQAGMTLKFQSGEKNSELATLRQLPNTTEIIVEKGDMYLSNDKLFLPYYFTFKTQVPINYLRIMNTNPYGLIEFDYDGVTYNGFIIDGGIKPATNDVQQWKLLAGPLNDMSKLI